MPGIVEGVKHELHPLVPETARLLALPADHPLFSAAYHLRAGFPGNAGRPERFDLDADGSESWELPPPGAGLSGTTWGIEIDGRLQVVLCAGRMFRDWQPNPAIADLDSVEMPTTTPYLQAAANIVVYALQSWRP